MPIYEYRCPVCDTSIEKLLSQPKLSLPCPHCKAEAPRVVSACAAAPSGAATGSCGAQNGGFS